MKYFLFLFLTSWAGAQVPHIQVRVVTFQKAGAATALAAAVPDCDESLYASLAAEAGTGGKVRRVYDQTVIVRSGDRAKVEAFRDYAAPEEYYANPEAGTAFPASFRSKLVGQVLEAEATAADEENAEGGAPRVLELNLAPDLTTLRAMYPWPVPDFRGGGKMGKVLRPVFGNLRPAIQVMTWTGRTILITVSPAPETAFSEGTEPEYCYTFVRGGLSGEKPAAPGRVKTPRMVAQRRLHLLSIRLPRNEAAALLLLHTGDDAALYAALKQQVNAGTAVLTGHTSVLCRDGQRSKVVSGAWFDVPGSYVDLVPDEWMQTSPGVDLEVEADGVGEEDDGWWNMAYTAREAPDMVPYYPSAKYPALHGAAAEFVERQVSGQLRIPHSGVLCSSVLSTTGPTAEDGAPGGLTDVYFAMQSPPPAKTEKPARKHILLQTAVLSVPAAEGAALAAGAVTRAPAEPLLRRLQAGEITCAAHAGVVIRSGNSSKAKCVRLVQQPAEFAPARVAPEVMVPHSWSNPGCGLEFDLECSDDEKGVSVNGYLGWDAAPVLGFGEPGAEVPEMEKRRCEERVNFQNLVLKAGQPVVVDARASRAGEGTPEHGRWHVTVVMWK